MNYDRYPEQFRPAEQGKFVLDQDCFFLASSGGFWEELKEGCRYTDRVMDSASAMANINYQIKKGK